MSDEIPRSLTMRFLRAFGILSKAAARRTYNAQFDEAVQTVLRQGDQVGPILNDSDLALIERAEKLAELWLLWGSDRSSEDN